MRSYRQFSLFQLGILFLGGLVLLLIVAPLAGMFMHTSGSSLMETVGEADVRQSILLTLACSMGATLLFAIAAIPFAYFLARNEFPLKRVLLGVLDLPVVIPHSAAGIALLGILNRESLIGGVAERCGFSFVGHPAGIMAAMAFVSIPFLLNAAREGFAAVPERLEKSALTLGAHPARVFFSISLPLARRSILTGLVLMFSRGLSEFGAVMVMAYHPMVTPILIYERFTAYGLKYARGVSAVFILVCLVIFVGLRCLAGGKRYAARA
jgi:molybdate/tungstate transport system permease protein